MTIRLLEEPTPCRSETPALEARICLAGAGLSGGFFAALATGAQLDIVDPDRAHDGQQIVPTLDRPGEDKALSALRWRGTRYRWLSPERAIIAPAQALGEGYWRALVAAGGLIVACTDSVAAQTHLARMAAHYGLPFVATGLGPHSVEVLVAPPGADNACYGCLGRSPEQEPTGCFPDGLDAAPANLPEPPPTNSTAHLAALAAAVAIEEAAALAAGERDETQMLNLTPGGPVIRTHVERSSHCAICEVQRGAEAAAEAIELDLTSEHSFEQIARAAGMETDAEIVLPGPGAQTAICRACESRFDPPHLLPGRPIVCGECHSWDLLVAGRLKEGSGVSLEEAGSASPRSLGWPWWPVIDLVRGDERVRVELAGDARERIVQLSPVVAGG